jgi:hypothetical protein
MTKLTLFLFPIYASNNAGGGSGAAAGAASAVYYSPYLAFLFGNEAPRSEEWLAGYMCRRRRVSHRWKEIPTPPNGRKGVNE